MAICEACGRDRDDVMAYRRLRNGEEHCEPVTLQLCPLCYAATPDTAQVTRKEMLRVRDHLLGLSLRGDSEPPLPRPRRSLRLMSRWRSAPLHVTPSHRPTRLQHASATRQKLFENPA